MLQRIQSVYLFIAFVLDLVLLFSDFIVYKSGKVLNSFGLFDNSGQRIENLVTIAILIIIIAALNFLVIFMYKDRVKQMRTTVLIMLLLFGVYIMIGAYHFFILDVDTQDAEAKIAVIIPAISIILMYMANRRIKKDEDLVRSVDRIR